MNPRARKHAVLLATLAALTGASAPSAADAPAAPPSEANKVEASSHFRKGVVFYKDGDFREALVEFRRANQLAPSNAALYDIARCHAELREHAKAMTTFERYLAEASAELDDAKRKAIVEEMRKLEQRVARVDTHVTVDGADVSVDGELVGASPLPRATVIDIGSHTVTVSKLGYTTQTKPIEVAAGDHAVLDFDLRPAASPGSPSPAASGSEAARPGKHGGPSTGAWVTGVSTVVLAAVGGTFGVLAINAHGDLASATNSLPGNAGAISSDHERMQVFSAVADTAGALAVATGAVTLVLLLTTNEKTSDKRPAVGWEVSPLAMSLHGHF